MGFAIENRTRRPVAQRLMQPLLVVEPQPVANALARPPCVTGVAARIGLDPLGAQEDGRGSIRTAI